MIFLGSYWLGDFVVMNFVKVDNAQASSPLTKILRHKPISVSRNLAYALFLSAIIVSSVLAVLILYLIRPIEATGPGQPIIFPIASSFIISGLLWIDYFELFREKAQETK